MKDGKYRIVERAVTWLLIMLIAEFVLGTLLTTVIGYNPHKHSAVQTTILVAHIALGVGLMFGSFAHILTSRSSHLLGVKPVIGFLSIAGAFSSGVVAAKNGNNSAVLLMALFFGVGIVTYGLSFVAVKVAKTHKT